MATSQVHFASDLTLSRFVAGVWRLMDWDMSDQELLTWIEACIEMGVTTFDHADIYGDYGCEEAFGRALSLKPELRQKIQIVTKCGIMLLSNKHPDTTVHHYDTSKAHILAAVEQSLRNLRTDVIDVLLIHRPDPLMDADEVAAAFHGLKRHGKVRHFGVSNFTPTQFELLDARLDLPLITNQLEISVSQMEALHDGTLDQLQRKRIHPMAWSPLGGGRIFNGEDAQSQRLRTVMTAIGAELGGARLDQVALAWLLMHPTGIVPVLGTGKTERIQAAIDAEQLPMTRQQWFKIWQASAGHEVP